MKDALEVTRNLHRLIITASLVTLVFSLSLRFPDQTRRQRDAISQFLRTDFSQYERDIEARGAEAAKQFLLPLAREIRESLRASNLVVSLESSIADAFEKPILLGQFKVDETKLTTPSELTVRQLERLGELYPLTGDVRIVVAETANLLAQVHAELLERGRYGMIVQRVRLEPTDHHSAMDPPADGDRIMMQLSFELIRGGPPSEVIVAVFEATVRQLPGTSFRRWLEQRPELVGVAEPTTNGVKWLPALNDLPREAQERRLGDVLGALNDELQTGSPESKSVSLLGTEIPGFLLVYAAPMTLLALSYYFLFHLAHVCRFASRHKLDCERFAWLPLSLETGWVWEALISLGVLPVLALSVLITQLWRYNFLEWGSGLFTFAAALGAASLNWRSVKQVGKLRGQIGKSSKIQLWSKSGR